MRVSVLAAVGAITFGVYVVPTIAGESASVFERVYSAIEEEGAEAAVDLYRELKMEHADEYEFSELDLLIIGDKLLETGRYESAIIFLEASRRDYPESNYAYLVNYDLAMANNQLGNRGEALCYCRMAFELAPHNPQVARLLDEFGSTYEVGR